ncbi:MAG: thioredoxin domain-containing protein [Polyangiaceae bacterium]|nr:thioredoxin domain-containing protein [Polyangiaceae bacterium]
MSKSASIIGFLLSFVLGMGFVWMLGQGGPATAQATAEGATGGTVMGAANPGAVKVDLFVMSQCPYGVQAEQAFAPVIEKFGKDIDFKVEYVGGKPSPDGSLSSMHGPNEVKGDIAQLCAMKLSNKWFDFITCQNKDMKQVATNWESCATEVGIPGDKLAACMNGDEGKGLLAASFKKAEEVGARGSPTIMIAGQKHQGGRRPADLMRAICAAYTGAKPAACNDIPESPKVNVTILTDKRCGADCNPAKMEGSVRQKVANPVLKTLDVADAEGKALFDAIKPTMLPAVVFDASLDADKEASAAFSRGLKPAGQYKVMAGGGWNPACADDGGCQLEECKATMACRPEEPNKLEVFVMSQCPFGVKGLDAMKEVLENFKKSDAKIDFQVHFIGDGDATSLKSMHGQGEVDEDIREACAIEHYGKDLKFMDYVWCRNKNIKDTNWQSCTGGDTGIDTAVIQKCFEGDEGKQLLAKSFAYSKQLGFGASPTWLANGKFKFSGVDAETIKSQVCAKNKLGGCDNKLSGPPPRPQGGAAAAAPGCGG